MGQHKKYPFLGILLLAIKIAMFSENETNELEWIVYLTICIVYRVSDCVSWQVERFVGAACRTMHHCARDNGDN